MVNNHKDITKHYYVAKNEDNTIFHYGKIIEGQVFSTSMPIKTFSKNEDMISFIEENGGTYIDNDLL
jgi:hypothetical protein